jgi:APA family basic amino acid/polyamine antiporter
VATVAVGWGGYVKDILDSVFGVALRNSIAQPPGEGGVVNLPAVVLVVAVMTLLLLGVRQSARTNTAMVIFKILVACLLRGGRHHRLHRRPLHPVGAQRLQRHLQRGRPDLLRLHRLRRGLDRRRRGREPKRDLPIAVVGSLLIATVIYILVAITAVGLAPVDRLAGSEAPLTDALRSGARLGDWAGDLLSLGASSTPVERRLQ